MLRPPERYWTLVEILKSIPIEAKLPIARAQPSVQFFAPSVLSWQRFCYDVSIYQVRGQFKKAYSQVSLQDTLRP